MEQGPVEPAEPTDFTGSIHRHRRFGGAEGPTFVSPDDSPAPGVPGLVVATEVSGTTSCSGSTTARAEQGAGGRGRVEPAEPADFIGFIHRAPAVRPGVRRREVHR